ncbi:MAG: hypothetical protein HY898_13820 [Deltaproteobacteria bacterium]|nr:hypothetical protein [Deltaproteobacteria bacterium]
MMIRDRAWMPRLSRWIAGALAASALLLLPSEVLAAGGKPASKLVNVADTRHLAPGLSKWLADLYNDNLLIYGLVVVAIMAAMGGVLGFVFDRATALFGINLGRLDHHE